MEYSGPDCDRHRTYTMMKKKKRSRSIAWTATVQCFAVRYNPVIGRASKLQETSWWTTATSAEWSRLLRFALAVGVDHIFSGRNPSAGTATTSATTKHERVGVCCCFIPPQETKTKNACWQSFVDISFGPSKNTGHCVNGSDPRDNP